MKNMVQLYFENKKKLPFIVRRENWNPIYGLLVTGVRPQKAETGWYGDVYGYPLPPLDGTEVYQYWGQTGKPRKLKNSGSYQWIHVKEIPEEWKSFVLETKEGSKDG